MTQNAIDGLAAVIFTIAWFGSLKAAHDFGWTRGARHTRTLFFPSIPGQSPGHPENATEDGK